MSTNSVAGPQLDLIGIVVEDMAASLSFYRRLGLAVPEGSETQPHVELVTGTGTRLAWDTVETIRSFDPGFTPGPGGINLAFRCADAQAVDSLFESLVEAGHDGAQEPWDAVWGQRYALVRDPDGHTVDLFAPIET
ncbi:VOC family protein [Nocardioides sp.]|uniref:VOC family protein n=1 Tax=Nocardioides sp. TaxID=35761 RepID=UPI00273699CB|nr:VOC family protein [Nocardioides sp.]MDP3893091.1 VOC family protein [Nocardioides sp.]